MLVRFSVRGCLSFSDTVTLRLVPSDHRRIKGTRYESCFSAVSEYKIMRSLLVFGPSGAGKTNLLIALQFLLDTILEGWTPALLPSGNGPVSFAISLYDETSARSYDYSLSYTAEGIEERAFPWAALCCMPTAGVCLNGMGREMPRESAAAKISSPRRRPFCRKVKACAGWRQRSTSCGNGT